eukprot:PhF_6_TR6943/c0_g1_i2/m.10192
MNEPTFLTHQRGVMYVAEQSNNLHRRISILTGYTYRLTTSFSTPGGVTMFFGVLYGVPRSASLSQYVYRINIISGAFYAIVGTASAGTGTNPLQFNNVQAVIGDCARKALYMSSNAGFIQSYNYATKTGSRLFGTDSGGTHVSAGPSTATSFVTTGLRGLFLDNDYVYIGTTQLYGYIVRLPSTTNSFSCLQTRTRTPTKGRRETQSVSRTHSLSKR